MHTAILFAILGLGAGAAYALVGQGVVVIYQATGVVNFAQGAIAMIGAYIYVWLTDTGLGPVPAALLTLPASALIGIAVQLLVLQPLGRAPVLAKIVAVLGILLVLEAAAGLIFGNDIRQVPRLLPSTPMTLFGITFGEDRLTLLCIVVAAAFGLNIVIRHTAIGALFRAAADSEE